MPSWKSAVPKAAPRRIFEDVPDAALLASRGPTGNGSVNSPPPPSRADARDTSPPLRGVEDTPSPISPPFRHPINADNAKLSATAILHPEQRGGGAERSEAEGGNSPSAASPPKSRTRRKPGTTERARRLRWVDNDAEGLLWLELKGRRLGGFHFTRQLPIGPYFADFACRKARLVIEVDGSQHADSPHDRRRDQFMQSRSYSILRFWNHDVLRRRRSVCDTILAALEGRLTESVVAPDLNFAFAPDGGNSSSAASAFDMPDSSHAVTDPST